MIIDVIGTPSHEDMILACEGARSHVLRQPIKRPNQRETLGRISNSMSEGAIDLLTKLLTFNPDKRMSVRLFYYFMISHLIHGIVDDL